MSLLEDTWIIPSQVRYEGYIALQKWGSDYRVDTIAFNNSAMVIYVLPEKDISNVVTQRR